MARTHSRLGATQRFQVVLPDELLGIMEEESILLGIDRVAFVRALINRAAFGGGLERPAGAPARKPLAPVPKSKLKNTRDLPKVPATKIALDLTPQQADWLRLTARHMGGMPYSSIVTYLVLSYCGINALVDEVAMVRSQVPMTPAS